MLKIEKVRVYTITEINYKPITEIKSTLFTTQLSECWPPGLICSSRLEKSFWGIQLAQEERAKDNDI